MGCPKKKMNRKTGSATRVQSAESLCSVCNCAVQYPFLCAIQHCALLGDDKTRERARNVLRHQLFCADVIFLNP